ncbi:cofactor-independent phosphoglycerate mutase [uncultured Ruminococcus sp.]|uniref:cofactor-independent phosphoglycerate mutase n=1 Tax=Massiliimalia timonensis TaxID=1987501 RepID=UPI000821337B|nr:cofactor-independent phosphoglycerate mutase [Massiliimalia timonensis]SCH03691.1 cofactor-independent phosphoglycerate mutase [uncultured Ruminococcus sp.]SCH73867.1 cofactor-independent phosphoglycerate mutase [uncultured Clostridium sp.]
MKHVVLLCDGMADYPLEQLNGKTPMAVAEKPNMNTLARFGMVGMVQTVADGFKPGSDVANLSVMGYDPKLYYTGRSPLEAASIGIKMSSTDIAMRCNLVTLSEEENYEDKTMVDYCADDISTAEAEEIVKSLKEAFDSEEFTYYSGVSYRHCLIWHHGAEDVGDLTPPHDISGRVVTEYLPNHPAAEKLLDMMKKSYDLLKDHPINQKRIARGLRPANSIWLWGNGKSAALPSFEEKNGLHGAVISAVDLIKGIGKLADMDVIEVEGATGYIDTNFTGKAQACIDALQNGSDFVYIHVEAPDECGHRFEIENKVKSLEIIDRDVLKPVLDFLDQQEADYKVMILPDHATPLALKTHVSDPIPFLIYQKSKAVEHPQITVFDEETAKTTGVFVDFGPGLLTQFLTY